MVERCLAKADIAGPNPVSRSMPRYRKIARLFTSPDSRGSRDPPPPNPVLAHDLLLQGGEAFSSVIRTRVDRGNPRIPFSPMTCCRKTVRFLHP